MLTNRTQVKDTQERIKVLQNILKCLQQEAMADEEKEKVGEKYVNSRTNGITKDDDISKENIEDSNKVKEKDDDK